MAAGQPRAALVIGVASALTAAGLVGSALLPPLLRYSPLLLIALSPRNQHLVLAAPYTPMVAFVAVATARRAASGVTAYYVGQMYGTRGIAWMIERYPWLRRPIRTLQWLVGRAAPLVIIAAPTPTVCALVGSTRMPLWGFIPVLFVAHVLWASLTYRLGEALSEWIAPIVAFFETYMLPTTLFFIACVVAYYFSRRNRPTTSLAPPAAAREREAADR